MKERDADIPGRGRLGTVFTHEAIEALGRIGIYESTTLSRSIAVVVEEWLVHHGVLAERARHHSREDYDRLCEACERAAQDGLVG